MSNQLLTKGELTLEDLPPIDKLNISIPEQEVVQIGVVSSIVEQLGKKFLGENCLKVTKLKYVMWKC